MAQVTLPYTLTAGTPENVNNLMSNLTALRDGVNTIDTAQIANGAITAQKLASGVGGVTDGSVTDAKLAAALADNLGITNNSNTRRAHVTATTERTVTSTSATDVTGASITLNVASNSQTLFVLSCEMKAANNFGSACYVRALATTNSVVIGCGPDWYSYGTVGWQPIFGGSGATSYTWVTGAASVHSALLGTGSQTIKVQFYNLGGGMTGYIKNVYFSAFNYVY